MDTQDKETFDLQGRIGCFSLTDLLQSLSFTQKTGTLTLIQGWNTRTICYEHGRITYIAAATRLPSVVDLLIQAGKLTVQQLERTLGQDWKKRLNPGQNEAGAPEPEPARIPQSAGISNGNGSASSKGGLSQSRRLSSSNLNSSSLDHEMGDLDAFVPPDYGEQSPYNNGNPLDPGRMLLKAKLVTNEELAWCEEQMLESTIYTLFLWRNCKFTFQGDLLVKTDGIPVSVSSEKLIIEGTRRVDEWINISPVIPSVLMAFRRLPKPVTGPLSDEAREVLAQVDGISDVATIARKRQRTQFDTAKLLHGLTQLGMVQPVPPDKPRVMELFRYTVEAVYIKLVMYGYSRKAMEFEYELNRFARENKLKVRMHIGKIRMTDGDLPIDTIALLDLYKLFIAIETNKFTKLFPPEIRKGLTEALYQHMDVDNRALMRMYEFHAMEGLLQTSLGDGE
ncbi:MAG: DUF4388 domain-containing protein [Chloroflexota bacterium]|nr:DUF4388 domain-containing protein [Chloroflexota bacterium]